MKIIKTLKISMILFLGICIFPKTYAQNGTLEAEEGVILGNNTANVDGTIRYTGTDFEGLKTGIWTSLTGAGGGSSVWNVVGTEINYIGNVGIGIANPSTALHIDGAGERLRISGNTPWWSLRSSASASNYGYGFWSNNNLQLGLNGPGSLQLETTLLPRMTIDNTGNVGIGTTVPEEHLHINGGDVLYTGSLPRLFLVNDGDEDTRIGFGNNGAGAGDASIWYDSSEDGLNIGTNTLNGDLHISGTGKMGVNISSGLSSQMTIRANAGNTVTPATLELNENNNSGYPVLKFSNLNAVSHFTNDANGFYTNAIGGDADYRIRFTEDGTNYNTILTAMYAYDNETGAAVDAKDERIGVRTETPNADLHLVHKNGVSGHGFKIEHEGANNHWWKMYVSDGNGTLSFRNDDSPGSNVGTFAIDGVYTGSDRKLKNNVQELSYGIKDVMKLNTRSYKYNTRSNSNKKSIGFIAQEVNEVVPEIVLYDKESDQYSINYSATGVLAIKAIQEQQEIIEKQQAQIDELIKTNKAILAQLKK